MAVCADDKALKIWRTQDWEPVGQRWGLSPKQGANDVMLNNKDFVIESNQCN